MNEVRHAPGSNTENKARETPGLSVFKIAATYVGTVVGAGFASGQEVLQFFGKFGLLGFAGLLAATAMFGLFGWAILDMGMRLRAKSHLEIIRHIGGRWMGTVIDYVITFFLFGAFTAMAAGAGAIFAEQFQWPAVIGSAVMVVVTVATVMLGLRGVITSISMVVPVLLASVVGMAVWTLINKDFFANPVIGAVPFKAAVPFWPLAAVLYVSYNLVMAVAVLAPTGASYNRPGLLTKGAILGGIGLGLGAAAILLALAPNLPTAGGFEIPMLYVAGTLGPVFRTFYSIVLLAEIYTTAVGSLYGFTVRLAPEESPRARYYIIGTAVAAFLASLLGFSTLVRTVYPAVGYAGLLLLLGLTYGLIRRGKGIENQP
ncbi:YkvI family membrane protein [Phosphitispora fastidiosa]|uniref:YkvI family membrane protein n=1 Tax=Phosphitispora fastidiosa TaxID=2837202 RepID=UPI001E5D7AAE|nr:hypothetical protein [Phosphitispora fastidiosa]MBU7008098.1 putative membrane protein YkvI [Phosphitispora fastidiosa]